MARRGGTEGRLSPPRVVITLALEAPPLVQADWGDPDDSRMRDWLDSHPAYWDLVAQAIMLAELERGRAT
jgi:hypothetical protein